MRKSHRSPVEKEKKEFSLLSPRPNLEKIFFYLLIFLLPTQLGKHFWPAFSQVLGIRIDYLSPTLYATDLLIFALFFLWFKRQKKQTPPVLPLIRGRQRGFLSLAWFTFFIYLCLNILFSGNLLLGLYGFGKILELFFLGYYVSETIKTKKDLAIISQISSLTVIGESLLAIAQYIHQGSINGLLYFLGERKFTSLTPGIANASINGELILRPYGTFPHPNVLAGFLLFSLIFIFAWFEDKKDIKKKLLKTTVLLLGSLALVLTLSRATIILWAVLIIGVAVNRLITQTQKKIPARALGSVFFVFVICIGLLVFTPVLSRLEGTSLTEESLVQRTQLLQSALTLILSRPLFGVGLENFLPSLSHVQRPISPTLYLQPVHNIYLLIIAEIGIIGAAFFLWFLFRTYNRLISIRGNTRNALLILLSAVLVLGLFDHYWLTLQQGQLLFALILGLCWARIKTATIKTFIS